MADDLNPGPIPPNPTPTPPGATPPGVSPLNYGTASEGMAYAGPPPDQDARTMGMLAHILGVITGWVGPLVIWLVKKDSSPFASDQAKEALNWEITLFIPLFALFILNCGLALLRVPFVGCLIYLLIVAIAILNLVFAIQGAIAANKGIAYRYPFAIRLIK